MCKKKFPYIAAYIVAYQAVIPDTHESWGRKDLKGCDWKEAPCPRVWLKSGHLKVEMFD